MNKNTVLAWATFIMCFMGVLLIALGAFRYDDVAGWGFAAVGIGFFANAWVFNALKGTRAWKLHHAVYCQHVHRLREPCHCNFRR